ncbi:probable salivary secreted peptide [Rhodnius prolixus]|uniref:Putative conserved secreted protein n=1 Tax=Rhodnius prolixus TaxID=13249 RepID=R4G4B7_RHOPR
MANISLVALLLVTCLYVTYGKINGSHDLKVGKRGFNDVLLFQKTVSKSNWKPWGTVSEDVSFPVKKEHRVKRVITEIDAIDLDKNDKGGYAYITKGGVNYNNVTIHFKSQKGLGFNFVLTIYGRNY